MRIDDPQILAALPDLGIELRAGASMTEQTSLGIGGTTDLLRIRRQEHLPELIRLLKGGGIPHRFLGGGTNLLILDGELPCVMLQLVRAQPDVRLEGNFAYIDCAADLGRSVTFCAKNDLGGMEGLIGVPGTVGGALRMNAGAYGTQIGSYVREVQVYRAGDGGIQTLRGSEINFEYRHTSFAPDDIMLSVKLELPSNPMPSPKNSPSICVARNPWTSASGDSVGEAGSSASACSLAGRLRWPVAGCSTRRFISSCTRRGSCWRVPSRSS